MLRADGLTPLDIRDEVRFEKIASRCCAPAVSSRQE
jgi:hypothetical protein